MSDSKAPIAVVADTVMVVYSVPLLFLGLGPALLGWFTGLLVFSAGILTVLVAILGINAANKPADSKLRVIWACLVLAALMAQAISLVTSGDTISLVGSAVCGTIAIGLVPVFYSSIMSRRSRHASIMPQREGMRG